VGVLGQDEVAPREADRDALGHRAEPVREHEAGRIAEIVERDLGVYGIAQACGLDRAVGGARDRRAGERVAAGHDLDVLGGDRHASERAAPQREPLAKRRGRHVELDQRGDGLDQPARVAGQREHDRDGEVGEAAGEGADHRAGGVAIDRGAALEDRRGVAQRRLAQRRRDALGDLALGDDAGEVDPHARAAALADQRLGDHRAAGALGAGEQDARRVARIVQRAGDPRDQLGIHDDVGAARRQLADPDQAVDQLVDGIVAAQEPDDPVGEPGRPHRRRRIRERAERDHAEPAQRRGVVEPQQHAIDRRAVACRDHARDEADVEAPAGEVVERVGVDPLELGVELGREQEADDREIGLRQREHADQAGEQGLGPGGQRLHERGERSVDPVRPLQVVAQRGRAAERELDLFAGEGELAGEAGAAPAGVRGEVPRHVGARERDRGSIWIGHLAHSVPTSAPRGKPAQARLAVAKSCENLRGPTRSSSVSACDRGS